jgi:hypothetical protein
MATLPDLIERMHKESPKALGNLGDRVVLRLLRTTFATVAADMDQAVDGAYKVGGLGTFRVRTVEPDAQGKGGGRRILFKPAQSKAAAK